MDWDRPPKSAEEVLETLDAFLEGRKEHHVPTVLTREQIFAVDDRVIEFVPVPEWATESNPDAGVFVRSLSGAERDQFEMSMLIQKGRKSEVNLQNLRAKLVVLTAVNSDDLGSAEQIFTRRDVDRLGGKSAQALQRIYSAAQRLSGLSADDEKEMTDALADPTQNDGFGSDSLSPSDTDPSPMLNAG